MYLFRLLYYPEHNKPDRINSKIRAHMHEPGMIDIPVLFIEPVEKHTGDE
jgi:hypothetical protein